MKVLLFDLGEVLFSNDWHYESPEKFAAYSQAFHITYDQMEVGWNFAWPEFELGMISEDAFWKKFLEEAGSDNVDIKLAKELWRKYFVSKDGMLDLLASLKKNYFLAVASSTGNEWLAYKREKYHLDEYFGAYFTTCTLHMKKTDKRFFESIIIQLGVPAGEVLLIDDTQKVLDVAKNEKIQTLLYTTREKLIEDLKEKGIRL